MTLSRTTQKVFWIEGRKGGRNGARFLSTRSYADTPGVTYRKVGKKKEERRRRRRRIIGARYLPIIQEIMH